jgi:hypothetical protein
LEDSLLSVLGSLQSAVLPLFVKPPQGQDHDRRQAYQTNPNQGYHLRDGAHELTTSPDMEPCIRFATAVLHP